MRKHLVIYRVTLSVILIFITLFPVLAEPVSKKGAKNEELITGLMKLLVSPLGYRGEPMWNFLADERNNGDFTQTQTDGFYEFKELIRRGPDALPSLLTHLNDTRPTKIWVGGDPLFLLQYFTNDTGREPSCPKTTEFTQMRKEFTGKYNVKVGDIIFGIIGQIVGRFYFPILYQHCRILIVNSPIENPELARKVKKKWEGIKKESLRDSLVFDLINADSEHFRVFLLTRLRFFFPKTYLQLKEEKMGEAIRKLEVYEKESYGD